MEVRVRIIGADSFGLRSLAVVVEAGGVKIFIDPGASYAPKRYGLPPHPFEIERLCKVKDKIYDEMSDSDIIVITHYHYDHYLYRQEEAELYQGKLLFIKNPLDHINFSQRLRAHRFLVKNRVKEYAKEVKILDNSIYHIDSGFYIQGSPPVPHGSRDTKLGYVTMVLIECCDTRVFYASDVQGPIEDSVRQYIVKQMPDVLITSGPPLYLSKSKLDEKEVERGIANSEKLARELEETLIIIDHHAARSLSYVDFLGKLRKLNINILSAAEYMGRDVELLEARRKELWNNWPEKDTAMDCNRAFRGKRE